MRVSKLAQFLENYYRIGEINGHRYSVLLIGAPGVGKSYTVRKVAERIAKQNLREFVEYNDDIAFDLLREPERYFVFCDLRLTERGVGTFHSPGKLSLQTL